MAQSFIFKINSSLEINEDIEDDDFFELEWNQFSTAIWEFSAHVLKTKSDEEKSELRSYLTNSTNLKDQVRYIFEDSVVYKEAEACVALLMSNKEIVSKKNSHSAHEFAKNAELHLSNNELKKALSNYNKAISSLNFTRDEQSFQKLLKQRAKVLFETGNFEASLTDIEDAIKLVNNSDQSIDNSLLEFKRVCTQEINKRRKLRDEDETTESNVLIVPFFNENELLPGASSELEMAYSPEKGRIIKARTNISKGKILFSEPAFACWLRPSKYKRYCFYCIIQLNNRYFPCRRCNAVRYCSFDCEHKAWTEHHQFDCDFLPVLQKMSYAYLAIKILLTQRIDDALSIEREDFSDLSHFPSKVFPHNYASFASLVVYSDKLIFEHLFAFCCGVVVLTLFLENMNLIDKQDENYFDVSAIILKLIYRINLNCFLIRDHKFRELGQTHITLHNSQGPKLGIAIYLSSSLISHSCDYNSLRISNAASMLLLSDRDIKQGEEITISYCPHYQKMSYKDRQKFLLENYFFNCHCCACEVGRENIAQALKCNSCHGPLIWNEDHSNYCLYCSEQFETIKESLQLINNSNELYKVTTRLMDSCEYDEAIEELRKIESSLDSICFSKNKQLYVKERLSLCFELKDNFKDAFKCLKETIYMRKELCGSQSLEVVYTLVYCIYLLKSQMKSLKNRLSLKKRNEIKHFRRSAINIMLTFQKANILLLDESYTHASIELFMRAINKYTSCHGLAFNFLKF